jgi:PII-like signaling protein
MPYPGVRATAAAGERRACIPMLPRGSAKKVTIYLNQDTRHRMEALWTTIFNYLRQHHVAGASVSRMLMGFGAHQQVHNEMSEYLGEHLPIRIEFIETAEKVEELLPSLYEMVTDGLIEVQDTSIVKSVRKDRERAPLPQGAPQEIAKPGKLVRIYLGESDRYKGEPTYEAIVKKLRMIGFSGATVYKGILGYGVKKHTHKAGLLHLSRDLPIIISVLETPERIEELVAIVSAMMEDGLIVISDAELYRIVRNIPSIEEEAKPWSKDNPVS